MSLDLSSKCRTCLSDSSIYHQLFDYVDDDYKILDMLGGIVPQIDVKNSSSLSTLVCQPCVDKLLASYKFQQLCIETNQRLHELLNISVSDTEPKQEFMLDPLVGDQASIKTKQELEEEEHFERVMSADILKVAEISGNDYYCDIDSSTTATPTPCNNFKQSSSKTPLKVEISEKPLKIKQRKSYFSCPKCGKEFTSINQLKQHRAIHIKKRDFSCEICKVRFTAEKILKSHMLTHTKNEVQIKNDNATKHIYNIGNNDDYKLQSKAISEHEEKEVREVRTFQCPYCPKCFKNETSLPSHYKIHNKFVKLKKSKKLEEHLNEDMQEISKVVVKEEIEITPQILEVEFDGDAEWLNNEYEESEVNSKEETFAKKEAKGIVNSAFEDTGIGEIEKLNSNNKRIGNFPCEMCGRVFDWPSRLKRHSSVHSLTRPHECHICKYRFANINTLNTHMFQHENESEGVFNSKSSPEGFKCPHCPRRFEKQSSLSNHQQIHTRNAAEQNYPCMICQRNFMSVRSLTEHVTNKHPEVEKHKCDRCDKTFVLHAHLTEHLNRHKGNRNLVCLICEKEFRYPNTLKDHMRRHSRENPYLCPQCGKTYQSESNLRQHIKRHTGLKEYECSECPSRFNCGSDLIKHASTHSNAKPHVCDICGSRFTRSYSLQKHKRLHSGERPFKCEQCYMSFAIIDHLRTHMRTHTGEKPYKCKFCERSFLENGNLTKHLRTHVGENTYICDQCPMSFKYQAELRQHQSQHYKMSQKLQPDEAQKQEDINEQSKV